jgi:tRNA(fMet)-specific endonuclease VapC
MKYILDTNVCIGLLKGKSSFLRTKIENISTDHIIIPAIVRFELYYGAYKSSRREETLQKLNEFLTSFETIELDNHIAETAGKIRADIEKKGTTIGPYDLLIGASAIYTGYVLVTHNTKEFSRIPDLMIEDWEA